MQDYVRSKIYLDKFNNFYILRVYVQKLLG